MIKFPYEQGRTRGLNKIEICFSLQDVPRSAVQCVSLFSVSSETRITMFLLSSAGCPSGAVGKRKDEVAVPPADGSLIVLPGGSTHTSAQHLISQNSVTSPAGAGKCTPGGYQATQICFSATKGRGESRSWGCGLVFITCSQEQV